MKRFSSLACLVGLSLVGCTTSPLEPIVDPGAPSGTAGGTPVDSTGPTLIYAHDGGVRAYVELQDDVPPLVSDLGLGSFMENSPVASAQVGHDLVVASNDAPGEVTLVRFANYALGGNPMVSSKTGTLPTTTMGTPQSAIELRGDASGGLWMRTHSPGGGGDPHNLLGWSPSGSIEGPWVAFEASYGVVRWALLPDQQTIVASNPAMPAFLLHVDRVGQQISLDASQTGRDGYIAFEVFDGALYALNFGCESALDCSETGELHIWRDLDDLDLLAPTATVEIPESESDVCALAVSANALAVGTCVDDVQTEPRLHVYRSPEQLVAGALPDQTIALADEPWRLVSHSWHDDDHQRTVSIYMHGLGEKLYVFEDVGGGPLQATELATSPSFNQGRALHVVP